MISQHLEFPKYWSSTGFCLCSFSNLILLILQKFSQPSPWILNFFLYADVSMSVHLMFFSYQGHRILPLLFIPPSRQTDSTNKIYFNFWLAYWVNSKFFTKIFTIGIQLIFYIFIPFNSVTFTCCLLFPVYNFSRYLLIWILSFFLKHLGQYVSLYGEFLFPQIMFLPRLLGLPSLFTSAYWFHCLPHPNDANSHTRFWDLLRAWIVFNNFKALL